MILQAIVKWLSDNKHLFSADKMKIVINIKGKSVIAEVTHYPDPIKIDKNK